MAEQTVTNEGRQAIEVEIAGVPHVFRFGMRTVLRLRRQFKDENPHMAVVSAWADGDEEKLLWCLWACLCGEAEAEPRKNGTQPALPSLDDVTELMQRHVDMGGETSELAEAVFRAWEAGGVNRKMAEIIKKKVQAVELVRQELMALTEPPSTEESPSTSGSTDTSGPPSATAASASESS